MFKICQFCYFQAPTRTEKSQLQTIEDIEMELVKMHGGIENVGEVKVYLHHLIILSVSKLKNTEIT